MTGKNRFILLILVAGSLLLPLALNAEDTAAYDPISAQQLREIMEDVRSWAASTIELLNDASNLTPREIVERIDALRRNFDPLMVLLATTEPAGEYKRAAVMLLMGTKGVELSLWHYIYAVLGDSQNAKDHGDVLLRAAVSQLNDAHTLFSQLP